ncbi:hypothetical protein PRUPE_8G229400 [Prunus persica]|uniref:Uncharacterized protein n=1 Tax=Prunus persica TaxID=3760 RepID=A0A251N211_PRUPE|nr:hypothetical protein PRUPE_8G229400 [Prunus persica]
MYQTEKTETDESVSEGERRMASAYCPGKSSWPEIVGEDGEVAAAKIEQEKPDVHAIVIPEGTIITQELRCNRVRVWVDENGVVTTVPRVG